MSQEPPHTISLTEFRRQTAETLEDLHETGQPLFLTNHGKTEAVLIDPQSWNQLLKALEQLGTATGILRGLRAADRGDTRPIQEYFEDLRRTNRRAHLRSYPKP